jgi:hypothetical protein
MGEPLELGIMRRWVARADGSIVAFKRRPTPDHSVIIFALGDTLCK